MVLLHIIYYLFCLLFLVTNIQYDKKKNNQHLLEHNYFLAGKLNIVTFEIKVNYIIISFF